MPSYKYYHITRKVNMGGKVSLMDESIQGGCNYIEAQEEHERKHASVEVTFEARKPTEVELEELWNEQQRDS